MATIAAIYTGRGLEELINDQFSKHLSGHRLVNIVDDGIIHDVIREGKVTKPIVQRLLGYYRIAADTGADYILNTCSSVGEVAVLGQQILDVPVIRIDEPMAKKAASGYDRIGVVATLPTTLEPTVRLLESKAAMAGREVCIVRGLAEGAYQSLICGNPQEHDAKIIKEAERLAEQVDCIVLAQGSMARMQDKLYKITGRVVLSSPSICFEYLNSLIGGNGV